MGLDILPETPNQDIDSNDIIFTKYYSKTIKLKKINFEQQYPPNSIIKEVCYINYTNFN